ncbi:MULTISPECIES: Crp/Fnr family transcriptional regulator [Chryseobacterium]|uniref:Crp/Fnr family transcriptional regulator n=1 Tax=Chryseobacterium taklimakanense TaxID=536441 RepID=A0A239WS21_9FLAO|nr:MULTISPECIES: Crp/Fnr family transcriptional regulator [Chryseobacterium]AZI20130.1 Crp/Fnr family transcriptional regulator [Chryseobacterium taklimakanense]RST28061.1 Crp/Fnr family transcriptional regulator [Chryseobacterium lacus]SNV37212.1 Cyclic nucleotide-binding domain [Chryseobacterium taklimakanense]
MTFPEMLATYITIDDDIRSFLNTQTEKISVKKGTVISDQNTLNRKVYFVEKGLLRSFYFEKGKDITTNFYPENSILANKDTIFEKIPARHSIEAIEDSEIVFFRYSKMEELCETSLTIANFSRRVLGLLMTNMERRINSLQYMTAKEKYIQLLEDNSDILLRAPLGMIASYLGISQETLSRIRSEV